MVFNTWCDHVGCIYANDQVVQCNNWHEMRSLFPSAHTSSYSNCAEQLLRLALVETQTQNVTVVRSFFMV